MTSKSSPKRKPAAKKKAAPKKKPAKKSSGKKTTSGKKKTSRAKAESGIFRKMIVYGLFALVCVGTGAGYYLYTHPNVPQDVPEKIIPPVKDRQFAKPDFEVFPREPLPERKPSPVPVPHDERPRVAIIIDDLGLDKDLADKFLSLEGHFTYAILPWSRFRKEIAHAVHRKGYEVMLHLPMEPDEYPDVDPGPGALLASMGPDERIRTLRENLADVPYISGVNNHMGSKITSDSAQMNQVLSVIKQKGLFFIDSRTIADTKSKSSARLFQVPFAERDLFLDHEPTASGVRKQILRLIRTAEEQGQALGIGHPYPVTYEVLKEMLPEIKSRVQLIPASQVVRVEGS